MRKRWTTGMLADVERMDVEQFSYKYEISKRKAWKAAGYYGKKFIPLKSRNRKFYAEDVALLFELSSEGLKSTEIALATKHSPADIRRIMIEAKEHGFDAYPPRPQTIA